MLDDFGLSALSIQSSSFAAAQLYRGLEVEVQVAMRHKKVIVIYFQPSPILHAELMMNRKTALRFAPEAMPVLASQQRQGASKGG